MKTNRGAVRVEEFTFESGDVIPLDLAYETYGDETGDAVLVCHALTGSQRLARTDADDESQARAWWNSMVGPGKPIDTDEYFVVCVNVPGSCYGSTGPASTDPSGERYAFDFPDVTVTDWVDAQRAVLDELGVEQLHAVVGGSVGGMNVLEWAKRYPSYVRNVVPIATGCRLNVQCLALDAIARRAITSDPNWNGGDYYDGPSPDHGLALARQIGHVMYLSEPSMREKFGREPTDVEIEHELFEQNFEAGLTPYRSVESYLDYQAQSFVGRFDANSYLFLSSAMDNYDLAEGCPSDAVALSEFQGRAFVVSFTGDWHFPVEDSERLVAALREAGVETFHHVVDSQYGHDAFLVETEKIGPEIRTFLDADA